MQPDTKQPIRFSRRRVVGWLALGVGLAGSFLLGAVRDARYGGDLSWLQSYTEAQRAARDTNRPLLVTFHRTDCEWCRKMEADTFTDPAVVSASHGYVCVRLDGRVETDLAKKYEVIGYPTTLAISSAGKVLGRLDGYAAPAEFLGFMKDPGAQKTGPYLP
jgi:thioredoxin-related protein